MKTAISLPPEKKFYSIISPYNLKINIGNVLITVGRGSLSGVFKVVVARPELYERPEELLKIGSYCEFSTSCEIIIGGEHINSGRLINTFSESPHLRALIGEKNPAAVNPINKGKIVIGNNVILSSGVRIFSGSVIGDEVIVASGAVCAGKQYIGSSIIGGIPARVLRRLEPSKIEWWNLSESDLIDFKINSEIKPRQKSNFLNSFIKMEGSIDRYGKIISLSLLGFEHKGLTTNYENANNLVKKYFNQVHDNSEFIDISDEIFNYL